MALTQEHPGVYRKTVHASAPRPPVCAFRHRGFLSLDLAIRAKGNTAAADQYYRRRFYSRNTKEVQLFLGGGIDTVLVRGDDGGLFEPGNTVSVAVAHGDTRTAFYLRTGFMF